MIKINDHFVIVDIKAANVEIVDTGTVAYFPPRSTVDEVDGTKLKINFGNVKNAAPDATNVTVDVTFNLISFEGTLAADTLKATIGGVDVTLPLFEAAAVVSIKTIFKMHLIIQLVNNFSMYCMFVLYVCIICLSYYRRHLYH